MMPQETPIVLISPEARELLEIEVDRSGATGELTGGLLFGYATAQLQRLVVSSVRLSADVGFGREDFSLDQTRTSKDLDQARQLDSKATYCGVWYLHRNPNRELTAEEWRQAQTLLEDPDFPFNDLVCLVLCFYYAELNIYATSFNRHHSARGQAPAPTEIHLTTDHRLSEDDDERTSPTPPHIDWYKASDVATRLTLERQRLAEDYGVERALGPNGQLFFRLAPKHKYGKLSFYLSIGPGFPDRSPQVFLVIGGKRRNLSTPNLGSWSSNTWLVEVADGLMEWLAFSTEDYWLAAQAAFNRDSYAEAADLLTVVLAIEPRWPGAARLLAKAQAPL